MPWNSCLFRKIHMPFTDTFMTHVLAFSGKEAEGLRGLGQAVPVAMLPPARRHRRQEVLEGIATRRAFSPARASSAGPALPGKVGDC